MKLRMRPIILVIAAMIVAPVLSHSIRPTRNLAESRPTANLAVLIPLAFGDWNFVERGAVVVASPEQAAALEELYSQVLTRTYSDRTGYRVMLSIAYGKDQSDGLQVHRPEVCYPAQGFSLVSGLSGKLVTSNADIVVKRLVTSYGARREPITYWITVGNQVISNVIDKKLVEMRYRIGGAIPDGLLFRVSSIDDDTQGAFDHQERFVDELLNSVPPDVADWLAGASRR